MPSGNSSLLARAQNNWANLQIEQLEARDVPSTLLEWTLPSGGGEFRLSLQNQQLTLEQIGGSTLFQADANDTTVQIAGTSAPEHIRVDFNQADSSLMLKVLLQTYGGGDEVEINLSSAAEAVDLSPQTALVQTPKYRLEVNGTETIRVFGNGGLDTLHLSDGPGDDTVEATPDHIFMTATGVYLNSAVGFRTVRIDANPHEINHAIVEGSAGNDLSELVGLKVRLKSLDNPWNLKSDGFLRSSLINPWSVELNGFLRVSVNAEVGAGYDQLMIRDSPFSDDLTFEPNRGLLKRGDGIEQDFQGFEKMWFSGNSGKNRDRDVVHLFDSAGMETFRAVGQLGIYLDGKDRFDLRIKNADVVYLSGSAGGFNVLSSAAYSFKLYATDFVPARQLVSASRLSRAAALRWIKEMALRIDPTLAQATSAMDLAIRLRDFVHHRTVVASNTTSWPAYDAYGRFLQAIVTRQESVLCQGRSWLYRDLLNAFGIKAREIHLRSANDGPKHSSTEVFLDGHWFVMDASFNVSFTDNSGRTLSYAEMKKLGQWNVQHDGTTNQEIGTLDFFFPFRAYLHRILYPALYV